MAEQAQAGQKKVAYPCPGWQAACAAMEFGFAFPLGNAPHFRLVVVEGIMAGNERRLIVKTPDNKNHQGVHEDTDRGRGTLTFATAPELAPTRGVPDYGDLLRSPVWQHIEDPRARTLFVPFVKQDGATYYLRMTNQSPAGKHRATFVTPSGSNVLMEQEQFSPTGLIMKVLDPKAQEV